MKTMIGMMGALGGVSLAALSGTVNLPSGSALSGVTVSLARTAGYGTSVTGATGKWTLAAPTGISSRAPSRSGPASHLQVREGRISLDFAGNRIDGRTQAGSIPAEGLSDGSVLAGRSTAPKRSPTLVLTTPKVA